MGKVTYFIGLDIGGATEIKLLKKMKRSIGGFTELILCMVLFSYHVKLVVPFYGEQCNTSAHMYIIEVIGIRQLAFPFP